MDTRESGKIGGKFRPRNECVGLPLARVRQRHPAVVQAGLHGGVAPVHLDAALVKRLLADRIGGQIDPVVFCRIIDCRRLGRYAVRGLNPALILWGMLLMAATNVVLEPLLQLLPEIPDFYGRGWRALLLTVVMAPLAEEFLCRGILLDAARAKGGAAYGLLFSALFFGVIHFYPAAVVNAFVMGLLLGFIYIRSNSLYIVVILHAFNNALAMLLLTLGYAHTTLYELMSAHGLKMLYTVVYGVSLGIFLVAGYMVWKTIARLREQEQAAAEAQ